MKLIRIKDGNEAAMDYYFPLVNHDETILAEGSLSRNVTNPWDGVLGEFIKERNLVGNDVDDIQDLIDEMNGNEMEAVIEEAGFFIYHFNGYSQGDHYAIISDRQIGEEYLEELKAIVFGGDWYTFSLVSAEEVKPLQVVVNGVDEFYGPEFFHQPFSEEWSALFRKEVLEVLEELTSIAGTEGIDGVIIPNTNNYLDDEICEVILANTDLQFYEELGVTSGRVSTSKFSKRGKTESVQGRNGDLKPVSRENKSNESKNIKEGAINFTFSYGDLPTYIYAVESYITDEEALQMKIDYDLDEDYSLDDVREWYESDLGYIIDHDYNEIVKKLDEANYDIRIFSEALINNLTDEEALEIANDIFYYPSEDTDYVIDELTNFFVSSQAIKLEVWDGYYEGFSVGIEVDIDVNYELSKISKKLVDAIIEEASKMLKEIAHNYGMRRAISGGWAGPVYLDESRKVGDIIKTPKESKKIEESTDEYTAEKYKGKEWGVFAKRSRAWVAFGTEKEMKARAKRLNELELSEGADFFGAKEGSEEDYDFETIFWGIYDNEFDLPFKKTSKYIDDNYSEKIWRDREYADLDELSPEEKRDIIEFAKKEALNWDNLDLYNSHARYKSIEEINNQLYMFFGIKNKRIHD